MGESRIESHYWTCVLRIPNSVLVHAPVLNSRLLDSWFTLKQAILNSIPLNFHNIDSKIEIVVSFLHGYRVSHSLYAVTNMTQVTLLFLAAASRKHDIMNLVPASESGRERNKVPFSWKENILQAASKWLQRMNCASCCQVFTPHSTRDWNAQKQWTSARHIASKQYKESPLPW